MDKKAKIGVAVAVAIAACVGGTLAYVYPYHAKPKKPSPEQMIKHARIVVCITEDLCGGSNYIIPLAARLHKMGVPMTFFVPAWEAYEFPNRLKTVHYKYGADLGNHANDGGASFAFLGKPGKIAGLPLEEQWKIIHKTDELLEKKVGVKPDAFRAPGLAVDKNTYKALLKEGIWVDSSIIYTYPGTRGSPRWIFHHKIVEVPIACYTKWIYEHGQPVRPKFLCSFADDLFVRPKIKEGKPWEALENLEKGFMQYYRHGKPGRPTVFVVLFHEPYTANPKYWWIIFDFVKFAKKHKGVVFATIDDVARAFVHGQKFTAF